MENSNRRKLQQKCIKCFLVLGSFLAAAGLVQLENVLALLAGK